MTADVRVESDSMGKMEVPVDAYYGAQTARAVENFPISNLRLQRSFIRALGLVKKHSAAVNATLGSLPRGIADAIECAAQEVIDGKLDGQFVVDVFQTGSGTSTNMNANEVIANRAIELLGGKRGDKSVHPNDHVNKGQSSNDVIPTAIRIAALEGGVHDLSPALRHLHSRLTQKSVEFRDIIKLGRTHLQDATPIRLGQEFQGYASQVEHGLRELEQTQTHLAELPLGGTAVGTGINTHPEFARRTVAAIAEETGLNLREAPNHFEAQGSIDALVATSGTLKTLAVSLIKIANDVRWLGSGPRGGLGELKLPSTQPGSSIMPGKVNPVIPEMLIQVCAQVMGNDTVITFSGTFGAFELNTMLPIAGYNLLQAIDLLTAGSRVFADRCIEDLEADAERCAGKVEQSLAMCTALVPAIGYDRAAKIAKEAYETGRTVRDIARESSGINPVELERLLDPRRQTGPES